MKKSISMILMGLMVFSTVAFVGCGKKTTVDIGIVLPTKD